VKVLTLALGTVVATSAIIYLNASSVEDDADLVAPRSGRSIVIAPASVISADQQPSADANVASSEALAPEPLMIERDQIASTTKTNLFRALEAPPPNQIAAASQTASVPEPAARPTPSFSFLGSFREGAELQAILQVGEAVEFAKPNQVVAGFRIDFIDSVALRWTHEPTSTKGLLQARGVR
jgi:hypothetical protein